MKKEIEINEETLNKYNDFKNQRTMQMYAEIDRHKTNHILHVILSVVTLGFWVWGWCIAASGNCDKRNEILKEYGKPLESNTGKKFFLFFIACSLFSIFTMAGG